MGGDRRQRRSRSPRPAATGALLSPHGVPRQGQEARREGARQARRGAASTGRRDVDGAADRPRRGGQSSRVTRASAAPPAVRRRSRRRRRARPSRRPPSARGIVRAARHALARRRTRPRRSPHRLRPQSTAAAVGDHSARPAGLGRTRAARSADAAHRQSGADVGQLLAAAHRPVRAGARARAARRRLGAARSRRPADRVVVRASGADRGRLGAARVARRTGEPSSPPVEGGATAPPMPGAPGPQEENVNPSGQAG